MPMSRHIPIAFTAALGAVGCSDAKARTMNTNGITQRPNAMAGAAAGPPGSREPAATSPTMSDQNAGARTTVATAIARHLRCGVSGTRFAG